LGKAFLELENLFSRCKQSSFKTSDFHIQFMILKISERDGFLFLKMDQNLPFGNTRGNGHALKNAFLPGWRDTFLKRILFGRPDAHGMWLQKSDLGVKEGMQIS
jgi:hypothetical protein